MSVARLMSLALVAAALSLPAVAKEEVELRGRFDADFTPGTTEVDDVPAIMPKVLVTERTRQTVMISKPAVLRYKTTDMSPARLAAERVGHDPDRPGDRAALRLSSAR